MISTKYILKTDEIDRFKDMLQSYCAQHKQKFNYFTVKIVWKKNDLIINKSSVPCSNSYMQTNPFTPIMEKNGD